MSQIAPPLTTNYKARLSDTNTNINRQISELGMMASHQMHRFIHERTQVVDEMVRQIFACFFGKTPNLALFAVGGYGRCELFPYSDVDLLLLGEIDRHKDAIEQFVATLWDAGITPAIAVRTLTDLHTNITDHTVATAILDTRFLVGDDALADAPLAIFKKTWTTHDFYQAKISEAKDRHLSHNATEYNLEPNLKNGVGTLRDIHILHWLDKCHRLHHPDALTFISDDNAKTIHLAKEFLWCLRHHLHVLSGRGEDRLLFEHQKNLATRLNFPHDKDHANAQTEALMRAFYHHVMTVATLSEMLCDFFAQSVLNLSAQTLILDDDFCQIHQNNDTFIASRNPNLFYDKPSAMLTIFVKMGQHNIKKIQASTFFQLSQAVARIDDDFCNNPTHKALFLANLQDNNYLFHRLKLMKRSGVLSAYLPAFGQIMGLSQYDLFHRYTVDAHTLYLVRILHRFGDHDNAEYARKFDLVSQVYQKIQRKDILNICAIFHDIAKGRGGDHSELGAVDAHEFCTSHGMSEADAQFVAWLVREHLTMSLTAQKKDIYDPAVIAQFAKFVGSISRLNYLYVLTVADMNATNSQLWNTWRASLLKQLYISTYKVLTLGEHIAQKDTIIATAKTEAKQHLADKAVDLDALQTLWQGVGDEYFLKQKPIDIAWQSLEILNQKTNPPIIALKQHSDVALDAMLLFVCTPDIPHLFADTVGVLDKFGLSVLDATIITANIDGTAYALDSYVIIDRFTTKDVTGYLKSEFLTHPTRYQALHKELGLACLGKTKKTTFSTRFDKTLKHFDVPTQVHFTKSQSLAHTGRHELHLTTKDRPALLAKVGQVFKKQNIAIHGAKITTMGERAEDIFYISGEDGSILSEDKLTKLHTALIEILQ
ncbi:MAG: [protein-PII] uridylyltransferase [Moraxella sp.]|uniref:[protein-PII] uridylyltransferase n=1 Tax=Moraxella sp. TaxID=479 RepID=UPI0026DC50B2|nr:[protein-PII] uridylyltransferase [Moraxella sp.]MDO4449730.1 [protein-PII] uridylyltransferase [Moraxella sp.]